MGTGGALPVPDVRIEYASELQALACQPLGTGCCPSGMWAWVVLTDAAWAPDTVTENKILNQIWSNG